ncbi:MAG: isoprenylcysteine carboxylmethyltransferase family protein [Terriglobales bacterium]
MVSWARVARRIRVPLGFAFAAAYLWLAHPAAKSLLLGTVFIAMGLALRGLASGHVQKNEQLATTGPYAYTRNPLYLGSLILAIGFVIAARSLWIALILGILFLAIYLPVIRAEEKFLAQRFPEFDSYAGRVPRLFPRMPSAVGNGGKFSWALYWKHREYNATLGSVAIMAALVAKLARMFR